MSDDLQRAAETFEDLEAWARLHGQWRVATCVNLNAANNVMSAAARAALSSPLADKPASGSLEHRHHTGSRYVDLIETRVVELARELFHAATVEYRPMSGRLSNAAAIFAVVRAGDTVLALPAGAPGHPSYRGTGFPGYLGARTLDIPFDFHELDVDYDGLRRLARAERPRLIVVGTAILLFPYRLDLLREIADEVGALVMYDGAHAMGLIAGGTFQDPLAEGAHILTGSTQKSFPGPIGGLAMAADEALGKAISTATGKLVSNYQNNRVLAVGIVLAEMLAFGRAYTAACVANARVLAAALAAEGFTPLGAHREYTRSNQLFLDVGRTHDARTLTRAWESANLIASPMAAPTADPARPVNGVRIGVQEVTRRGMGPGEMETIARLLARVARGEDPAVVRREAADLAAGFQEVYYHFGAPLPPTAT